METNKNEYDYILKIVAIGDSGVGKSNLLSRYINDEFKIEFKSTIGVEFFTKTIMINDEKIKIQLWDTVGQERFRSFPQNYYRGSVGALIVYSISNKDSFNNIKDYWLFKLKQDTSTTSSQIEIMLIGNKCDLDNNNNSIRQVSIEEGKEFAEKNNLSFIETSALNSTNVNDAFQILFNQIYNNNNNNNHSHHSITSENNNDTINSISKNTIKINTTPVVDKNKKQQPFLNCC